MRTWKQWIGSAVLVLAWCPAVAAGGSMTAENRERSAVPPEHTWNLGDLYPSPEAWDQDLALLQKQVAEMAGCRKTLGRSAAALASCLDRLFDIQKRLYRLDNYASRLHDQDAADTKGQELHERIQKVSTEVASELSFFDPGILAIAPKKLKAMMGDRKLKDYRHYLDNLARQRAHVLSPSEEEIIARAGDLAALPYGTYQTLSTLNLPFPEVSLKDGTKVTLSQAMYTRFRAAPERADRQLVFTAFWGLFHKYRETFASLLSGVVGRDHFFAQVRKYPADLDAALDATNVPTAIYRNMIKQVRAGLPLLWRYLKLRQKLLGLPDLGYHDLYTSIIPAVDMKYAWSGARDILLQALAPLGEDYLVIMRRALDERWADVYPTKGKRSGAYMSGSAYDVHPYVMLNYNDDYESLSTTAHEFGHAAHSFLSNKNQPFVNAHYPIFTAEVASTVNEHLLRLHLTARESDAQRKLFLLGQYLESWRQTVFRQAMFAEFELTIHELAQAGTPLTADRLEAEYLKLLRAYYGAAEGVCAVDPLYAVEWAYIPHFYYDFYMFQYTTSFLAATAIAERVVAGEKGAREDYLSMLKAGGSLYPVELLRLAGVDMTTDEPYQVAFRSLEKALAEVEALSAQPPKTP